MNIFRIGLHNILVEQTPCTITQKNLPYKVNIQRPKKDEKSNMAPRNLTDVLHNFSLH